MGYLALMRRPSVLLLWSAQTLSVLGDRLYALAVMWLAWQTTGSAALMGLVAVIESVPYVLVGMTGRRCLGRFTSLRALAWIDVVRAAVVAALPLLWHVGVDGVVPLLAVAGALGVLGALFDPNLGVLVPDLVERQQVQQVAALLDLTGRIARVVGPGSAGLLLLVLPEVQLYTLDAVTFATSAAALGWLARRAPLRGGRNTILAIQTRKAVAEMPAALPLLRRHPQISLAIGLHGIGLFFSAVSAIGVPIMLVTRLDTGAGAYGLVMAAAGLGALLGNPLAGHLRVLDLFPQTYCAAWAGSGLALAGISFADSLPAVMLLAAVGGMCSPVAAVAMATHLAHGFGHVERLRLLATDQTVIRAAGTCGMLIVPHLVTPDPTRAFLAGGAAMAVTAMAAITAGTRISPGQTARPASFQRAAPAVPRSSR